ncbi:hypothetical protein BGZ95_000952 [Linnemannia exigua]|uniref:Uncharacterized protein n=1 Tax=Linnemannia exigua TaxID=604196 RepID=A0AAD4HAY4_9FUNG|nr:hypothetical protein BGZ95_000952 [Linnemannia exigua]
MTLRQRFQQSDRVELLPVRTDKITGVLYTRLTDILRVFPDASFFRVNGGVLYYLEDENEQEYEPKRIAHHPDDTIDVDHQQLLKQLVHLLQEQAEAKERDERMLAELAAAKERDEEMLRLQRQTIDRLIVAQQRVEAILVQNYELHEYPIPRLFVILPDSYERWDPRNFLAERFRLFFLCECDDHCDTSSEQLAKHEGYELTRPTDFFDQYGPYVLGTLRILKHCLAVAALVSPAIALADSSAKEVMDGIKSLSESTMAAVELSIAFLQKKLDGDAVADVEGEVRTDEQEDEDDMFRELAALEGADLRRLDTFLRNKDTDKILGNLYRITTETGHVKWVCFDHYRQVYRETTMASFLQSVESNGGVFEAHLGKVTITLKSSLAAKDFFSRLSTQARAVTSLKVSFDWSFGSTDLVMLVDKVAQSNIRDFELDLMERSIIGRIGSLLRPGKGRYHSLLGLLSNPKLRGLAFIHVDFIGPRTSDLPASFRSSLLQSFHHSGCIAELDDTRLAEIITHCPHLVDLRLGSIYWHSLDVPKVDRAIGTLTKLERLHRYHLFCDTTSDTNLSNNTAPYGDTALRELVDTSLPYPTGPASPLEVSLRRSLSTLEVLMLQSTRNNRTLDLTSIISPTLFYYADNVLFSRLTHLEIILDMTPASLDIMSSLLPSLALVHAGFGKNASHLITRVNLQFLKSVHFQDVATTDIEQFCHSVHQSTTCNMESIRLLRVPLGLELSRLLVSLRLRRLFLDEPIRGNESLDDLLKGLNVSQLEQLLVDSVEYNWESEAVLASRSDEFTDEFVLHLPYATKNNMRDVHKSKTRDMQGSSTRLARHQVRVLDYDTALREYNSRIWPPSHG